MKKIVIHKPEIVPGYDDTCCRLSAVIESDHFSKALYYEVDKKYEDALCTERGDAYLLGLFNFAMCNEYDMEFEVPVSQRLYYQLMNKYIPLMAKNYPGYFHAIKVTAPLTNEPIQSGGGISFCYRRH